MPHLLLAKPNNRRLFAVAFILLALAGGIGFTVQAIFLGRSGTSREDTVIIIPPGAGRAVITQRLNSAGIYYPEWVMLIEEIRRGNSFIPKAGEYNLPQGTSLAEAMNILHQGISVQHSFTIPEGLATGMVLDQLLADDRLSGAITTDPEEGSLLPETYFFTRGTKRNDLILRMQQSQDQAFTTAWANRHQDVPFKSLEEAVILASIVEKETGQDGERGLVASVFINRLHKGMRLQSDPTTIYSLEKSGTPVKRLLQKHLTHDSPWNTYKYRGLPPTPITNPGLASLNAVLNPDQSDYLYFVANGKGGHAFAKTLDEHNKNVAAWRKISKTAE
jgi:UPF0755 protein